MAKFIEFLKPDLKRIIVLLIILSPIIFYDLHFPLLPVQFDLLNAYFSSFIIRIPFLIAACYLGGWDCGDGVWVPYPIFYVLTYSFGIIICYLVSCLIVFSWNNIFGRLGKEKRKYEKMLIKSLIIFFILITIILPTIGNYFVIIETNTRQNMSFNEAFRDYQPKLQELTIQNHFILQSTYELPNVTACVYDIERNIKWGYDVSYKTEDGRYVEDMDPYHRNVIIAKPGIEMKIFLQGMNGLVPDGNKNNLENFDEIILFSNDGMNNYNYCHEATEETILASEKIKISK